MPTSDPSAARVAAAIVAQLVPRTVLVAGDDAGLATELRALGVDVTTADATALDAPVGGPFDLAICLDGLGSLDPAAVSGAIGHLAAAGDALLLSASPAPDPGAAGDARPPERWSRMLADHGLLRDFRHDAAYVSPWAALYRRQDLALGDVVLDYDRAWSELRAETLALRAALTDARRELDARSTAAEVEELRKEVLRLRDLVIGREAELATALGKVTEMESMIGRYDHVEQRLQAVLESNSWRIGQLVTRPLHALRKRAG
ncbi:MAG TPA: hypothetical protein VFB77_12645 [Acidimicrobiales bacterium]|nr:hypothetical protein [Acidimicrobiales bacterium]